LQRRKARARPPARRVANAARKEWSPPDFDVAELTLPLDLPVNLPASLVRFGNARAEGQPLQDTVALFVALGGGWWNRTDFADAGP